MSSEEFALKVIEKQEINATPYVKKPRIPVTMTYEEAGIRVEKDGARSLFFVGDKQVCGARRRNGTYCMGSPVRGANRCRIHGGLSLKGAAHGRFKDGKYTRDLPSRLSERYMKAVNDEKLLELRDDIALIEARIGDLITRVDTGESGAIWKAVKKSYAALRLAAQTNNQAAFAENLSEMGKLINRGFDDYLAWDEIFRAVANRRKLVETERKRLTELKQMMTAEQAMTMLSFVVATIRKHVSDPKILSAISQEINYYLNTNTSSMIIKGKTK